MKTPLNSPLEVGIRVLMLLAEAFPAGLDLNDLVLLDHGLLHSAESNDQNLWMSLGEVV